MTGQLNLFKGKRQRGTQLPPPLEFQTHCALADTIRRWIMPDWYWFHYPSGELREHQIIKGKRVSLTGVRLQRMGAKSGVADFGFFHASGKVCWLELKRKGGVVSEEQSDFLSFMGASGHGVALCWSYEQAVQALVDWRILRGMKVQ
ncbi:hypothetical protein KIP88_03085 [Bradyrhizobium sp. SRL28]|uniref:hypothetical protein n=1 Tax=Bradyrhizobium sp. SRL28 TaxID=2836178 RepID=UPI001BDEB404|nr:hypothetical protein [Bradyrhizobium sp. SRL28]MBT1509477.1 hypothetical protein [Bradyrhizobium sp. SRL28]